MFLQENQQNKRCYHVIIGKKRIGTSNFEGYLGGILIGDELGNADP